MAKYGLDGVNGTVKHSMELSVLNIHLRESTVVRRMGPKGYMDGILSILRAKRTGTLFLDGWGMPFEKILWCFSSRRPIHISLEDVRTFGQRDVADHHYAVGTKEMLLALKELNRDRRAVLEQAWMSREGDLARRVGGQP